jgi:ABC-2 type transport system permease protein
VTWFGWHVPTLVEVAVVAAIGLLCLGVAIWQFSRTE